MVLTVDSESQEHTSDGRQRPRHRVRLRASTAVWKQCRVAIVDCWCSLPAVVNRSWSRSHRRHRLTLQQSGTTSPCRLGSRPRTMGGCDPFNAESPGPCPVPKLSPTVGNRSVKAAGRAEKGTRRSKRTASSLLPPLACRTHRRHPSFLSLDRFVGACVPAVWLSCATNPSRFAPSLLPWGL